MPYQEHYVFESPEENTKIWHYMNFTKFLSLLEKKALYFVTVEKLSEDDKFEGSIPVLDAALLQKAREFKRKEFEKIYGPAALEKLFGQIKEGQPLFTDKFMMRSTLINCWHMNTTEYAAMWKLYAKTILIDEGVAIQSTFKRLAESFRNYADPVYIGKVKYIDYLKDRIHLENAFYPFVFKRKSFEYERELRACIFKITPYPFKDKGEYIPVELNELIERIYVSPTAEDGFKELVESVVSRYDLDKNVIRSDLAAKPLY